jgi:ATP-dependent Clp protease adaptor protein ClpS
VSEEHSEAAEEPRQEESDTTTAVAPAKTRPRPKTLPPYRVLLHNDDVNDMLHVVEVVFRLTPLSVEEAVERMLEAHHSGVALLLVTHRERAELYAEQFATFSLMVTIEPDA